MDTYADGSGTIPTDNTNSWMQFAQSPDGLGLAPHQAAGVVANLIHESGQGLPAWGPSGDNGTAWGTAQWRGDRLDGLRKYAADNGLDPKSVEAQQGWMKNEFNGPYAKAFSAIKAARTPEDAATAMNRGYEISADNTGQREATARSLFAGGPQAIARAAGIKSAGGPTGALSFAAGASDDNDDDDAANTGALSPQPGALSPGGQPAQVLPGEKKSKIGAIGQALVQAAAAMSSAVSPQQSAALSALSKQLADGSKSNYQYMLGPDGTMFRIDKDSGGVESIKTGSAKKPLQLMKLRGADGVDHVVPYDTSTGQPVGGQPQEQAAPTINSIDDLRAVDPHRADAAQAVYDGRVAFPVGSRVNPQQLQLRNDVIAAYPGVDANVFSARKKFQEGKANSSPTSFGGLMQRQEIAADQLDKTLDSYGQLGNTDSMLGVNAAKAENYASSGGTENGRIRTELETNSGNAATDINAIQNGGRGSAGERETIKNGLNLPYDSHKVQAGAVQAHIDALKAGINSRFQQEKSQLGEDYLQNDPDYIRLTKKVADLQAKADKLYAGDFSYAPKRKGAASAPAAATPSGLPPGVTSIKVIQ